MIDSGLSVLRRDGNRDHVLLDERPELQAHVEGAGDEILVPVLGDDAHQYVRVTLRADVRGGGRATRSASTSLYCRQPAMTLNAGTDGVHRTPSKQMHGHACLVVRTSRASRRTLLLHVATVALAGAWPHLLLADVQDPDAGRDSWQRVPDLLAAMRMREGAHVADVGAGGGFITRKLAVAAGTGRVYAVEIDARIAERLQQRMQDEGLTNVEVLRGSATDPGLPADGLDAIIVVDTYHEFTEHEAMLDAFRRALRPGGRLVICDTTSRLPTREEQVKWHGIAPRLVKQDLEGAGFRVVSVDEEFTARGSSRKALVTAER